MVENQRNSKAKLKSNSQNSLAKTSVTIANEMTFDIVKFVFLKFALTTFQTTRKLPT